MYSGLIRDYYSGRWKAFFAGLAGAKSSSVDEWELDWISRPYAPSQPLAVPDLIAESRALLARTAG
jgi:hypothetical protein